MKKLVDWHKLRIGKVQNLLRIDNYETLWLSWLKGLIMGIILMSLLSGCYVYEGSYSSDFGNGPHSSYYDDDYYISHYVPTMGIYYWNSELYWGYSEGWYYYYGSRHMYPWWYYYHNRPAYHYNVHTHVHCHVGHRNHVTRPRGNRRLDNANNRTYNVSTVNTSGIRIKNNSNTPVKFQNRPIRNTNVKTNSNRNNIIIRPNRNNSNNININRSTKSNNKVNINRTNTNRKNSNRSNKSNNKRPR